MTLFCRGDFTLHSGKKSDWKIDCDTLDDEDYRTIAKQISKRYTFNHVVGVPRGGLKLAQALQEYRRSGIQITLLVDDVLTTGGSMIEYRKFQKQETVGVVLFARNKPPEWIEAIFQYWT